MSEEKFNTKILLAYLQVQVSRQTADLIESEVATNPQLASELAIMKGVRRSQSSHIDRESPGELGWARLSKSIDGIELAGVDSELKIAAGQSSSVIAVGRFWSKRMELWQAAACAMLSVAVWHTLAQPIFSSASRDASYMPVTSETVDHHHMRIIFSEQATEAEMRRLIRSLDAEIIAGPSAIGFYTLRFQSEELRKEALEILRSEQIVTEIQ